MDTRELEALLLHPREDLGIEIKPWLSLTDDVQKARMAKALIALANHGGGFLLLGFQESAGVFTPDARDDDDARGVSQDAINRIVARYAEPRFHCEVHHVRHPELGRLFPVVRVPGSHRRPIRSRRNGPGGEHIQDNTYYIRRPGPCSEAPQSAAEWDELMDRCVLADRELLLDRIRTLLLGADEQREKPDLDRRRTAWMEACQIRLQERLAEWAAQGEPNPYQHGAWTGAYCLEGDLGVTDLTELREALGRVQSPDSGWRPWWVGPRSGNLSSYAHEGVLEAWFAERGGKAGAYSDFWRASPDGCLYLVRGHLEDNGIHTQPGQVFDVGRPIWRAGEVLLHAGRLAVELGDPAATVSIEFRWDGLKDRRLIDDTGRRLILERFARSDRVAAIATCQADAIRDTLPELVEALVKPLYEVFEFFPLTREFVRDVLDGLLSRSR